MIDSHAHVHDPTFDDDRDAMLERSREAGISAIISIGTNVDDSRRALEIAERFGLHASIGIHPHDAKEAPPDVAAAFDALVAGAAVAPVAVGECGLDYHYDHSPRDDQRAVLVEQIRYARDRELPLIFHQREAFDDFLDVIRAEYRAPMRGPMRGVIHCFTGTADEAERLVGDFDFRLGIGGVLTFKTAEPLREAVRRVGLAPLILETDCPYLAPIPYRGKRNEPAFMPKSAQKLADVLQLPLEEVLETTSRTARELFRI